MGMIKGKLGVAGGLLACFLLVTGCVRQPPIVPLEVEAGANNDTALAVDLLTIHTPELANAILNGGSGAWFNNRMMFMTKYRDDLLVNHYQVPPGFITGQPLEWARFDDGDEIYLLVGNFVAGERLLKVEPFKLEKITVTTDDFQLTFN